MRFQVFENGSEDGAAALGFAYDLVKSLGPALDEDAPAVDLIARGNVAFEEDANPHDLLWTGLALRWSGSRALAVAPARREEVARDLADPSTAELAALDAERTERLAGRASQGDADLTALTERFLEGTVRTLAPELFWDLEMHGALESTQDFDQRQVAIGASAGGRLVSWDPDSRLSRYNVFDVPGATLRWLAGDGFRPSGLAYPSLVGGLDVVEASRDDVRSDLTDDRSFLRGRLEAQLRSHVASVDGEKLFLSAAWRFFQELNAPAAVRRAETDGASQLELRLDLPARWSISYTAGELPLDARYDSTFALGYTVRF